jgi:hypothetical protein
VEKEDILREIKRTAEENGGKPLGWRRFESETGISYSDWHGRHWVRWSDAVRDAGLHPNEFTPTYDDSVLLGRLAQLAREIGHLPVAGELRMKARDDPDFPHDRPFRRLGGKAEIVKRLHQHCLMNGGYDDVVRMCEAYPPAARKQPEETGDPNVRIGFVYLLKSGRFYKIGPAMPQGVGSTTLRYNCPRRWN